MYPITNSNLPFQRFMYIFASTLADSNMAYSHFTYEKIKNDLGIILHNTHLFPQLLPIIPSKSLLETLESMEELAFFSEKSRSEAIIFPILVEVWKKNNKNFGIYSGSDLTADNEKGLSGECDFIFGKGEQGLALDSPLFCMIEAKDQDIKKAIPQCIAQMEGARLYNVQHKKNMPIIWGCVTTGEIWLFLKLENGVAYIDIKRYALAKLEEVMGILQYIVS